jgi:hypothetical protein
MVLARLVGGAARRRDDPDERLQPTTTLHFSPRWPLLIELPDADPPGMVQATYRYGRSFRDGATLFHEYELEEAAGRPAPIFTQRIGPWSRRT